MRGRKRRFCASEPKAMITGPTMLTPNGSGEGAGACCISSWKMYCRTGSQPVPPHSTGQCGTAQPLALRMRVHSTSSSFEAWWPMTSLSRMRSGSAVRKNSRTSSRKAVSSGVKRRSMRGLLIVSVQCHPGSREAAIRDP